MYRVIYDAIDEIETAMKGMLAPKYREVVLGHAEVRETYKVSSVGTVAGCYVQDGCLRRDCSVRVVRDGIVVHEGVLGSLQRFKDSVKEVKERFECGLTVESSTTSSWATSSRATPWRRSPAKPSQKICSN